MKRSSPLPEKTRQRGRPSRGLERYNLYLDPEIAEWAKQQREGLSGLLRDLLAEERHRRESPKSSTLSHA